MNETEPQTRRSRYWNQVKNNRKTLAPALILSSVVAGASQFGAGLMENPPEVFVQGMGYWGALVSEYSYYLHLEYKVNREKYPDGFWSKQMLRKVGEFAAADYLADLSSYTPVFIYANHQMLDAGMNEGVSGLIASGVASTTYFFVMSGLEEQFNRATQAINKRVRNFFSDPTSV